jgi:hypothetical protein
VRECRWELSHGSIADAHQRSSGWSAEKYTVIPFLDPNQQHFEQWNDFKQSTRRHTLAFPKNQLGKLVGGGYVPQKVSKQTLFVDFKGSTECENQTC